MANTKLTPFLVCCMKNLAWNTLIHSFSQHGMHCTDMFGHGRGHAEYKGLAASLKLKALETVTFATMRFFRSPYEQWEKIYLSYKALIETYRQYREN